MLPFARITVIGIGLIGSSIARAVRVHMPTVRLTGYDADAEVREIADRLELFDDIADSAGAAVIDADLVILCVPVGAMGGVGAEIAADLPADAVISDVGSCKEDVLRALTAALPGATIVPAHPVAGTERSGPEAGFASLFHKRWCIITPPEGANPVAVERVSEFWRRLGAEVEMMEPGHHDRVLAITSHLPHLIAYTIVGTASDMEEVTRSEVIKYSAGRLSRLHAHCRVGPDHVARRVHGQSRGSARHAAALFRGSVGAAAPRSAGARATNCSTCSPAPGRSGAASSNRVRTIRRPISAGPTNSRSPRKVAMSPAR